MPYLENNSEKIYFTDEGPKDKPAILFLHAFPLSSAMWENQILSFKDNYRVITIDFRGFGKSTANHPIYSLDEYAKDAIELLNHLNISKAIWCGLSMGGYVALRAIQLFPDRFKKLILSDTKSQADTNEAKTKRFQTIQDLKSGKKETFVNSFTDNALCEKTHNNKTEIVETVKSWIQNTGTQSINAGLLAMAARTDTTENLIFINLPTLILVGSEDQFTPVSVCEELNENIPGSTLKVIPDTGHFPNLESPVLFNREVLDFLQ